jgi:hypothetical protein
LARIAKRSDDRPTEPAGEFLPGVPVIPRAARVPVFPEEWLDLVDDIQTASVTRRGERARPDQSFSTAPVLRQSYATLCEKVGRKRVPA